MGHFSVTKLFFVLYFLIFCVVSKILFINIYDTAGYIVDELFHIPQGLNYCQFNFSRWDPKITTLPGLYLYSTALLAPFNFCTVYGLRLTNLLASFINIPLLVSLFHIEYDGKNPLSWAALCSGISMGILPPLYFFSHLYYTDTLAVTTVLLMLLLSKNGCHISAAIVGALSIIVRQTNVIFVTMIFGQHALDIFVSITTKKKNRSKKKMIENHYDFMNIYGSVQSVFKNELDLRKLTFDNYKILCSYFSVLLAFITFVYINGSIVVGDKTAHTACLHIPQIFYFSLFCLIFALPHMCLELIHFIKFVFMKKLLFLVLSGLCFIIVHYNMLIHPYLLADNRHYTFYIWKRVYEKYFYAKYLLVFVYLFSIYAVIKRTDPLKHFGFLMIYIPLVILLLIPQKLVDVRYFLIPFILIRLKFKTRNIIILFLEYFSYLLINYLTYKIFFTKEIIWTNFEEPQRMMW